MRYAIAILVCFSSVFVVPTVAAKGGCGGDPVCEQLRAERGRMETLRAVERAAEEKRGVAAQAATSPGIEQVKVFRHYGNEYSYSNPYFRTEEAINAWLRGDPRIRIIRVVPVPRVENEVSILVFYRR